MNGFNKDKAIKIAYILGILLLIFSSFKLYKAFKNNNLSNLSSQVASTKKQAKEYQKKTKQLKASGTNEVKKQVEANVDDIVNNQKYKVQDRINQFKTDLNNGLKLLISDTDTKEQLKANKKEVQKLLHSKELTTNLYSFNDNFMNFGNADSIDIGVGKYSLTSENVTFVALVKWTSQDLSNTPTFQKGDSPTTKNVLTIRGEYNLDSQKIVNATVGNVVEEQGK